MTRPSAGLTAYWYALARASGYRDIEYGRDTNKIDGWTFRGSKGAAHVPMPDGFEPRTMLADHPTSVYYRGLEHAARALRGRKRQLLLVASEGNTARAARGQGLSRFTAHAQVRAFARSIGLTREAHGG